MTSDLRHFLRETPTSVLIGMPTSSWNAWGSELHCDQTLSRQIQPEVMSERLSGHPKDLASIAVESLRKDLRIAEGQLVELTGLGIWVHDLEWSGVSLLCNWAPTAFELDGELYASMDSFYHALKFPEASAERRACARSSSSDARSMTRRIRAKSFLYGGQPIIVGSDEHRVLYARALCAKLSQHEGVQAALRSTARAKLVFPLRFTTRPNVPGLVTPLCLMIERFKRWRSPESGENVAESRI